MKATTTLLARVPDGKGRFPFVVVPIKNDRPIPPTGATTFYARFTGIRADGSRGRIVKTLGNDLEAAYVAFLNLDMAQKSQRAGVTPLTPIGVSLPTEGILLIDAIKEYLAECKITGNVKDTLDSKTRTLESFRDVAAANGVFTIEDIKDRKRGRLVLLAYMAWMKENLSKQAIDGVRPENTYNTRLRRLGAFLKQQGIKIKKSATAGSDDTGLLTHQEFPRYKGRPAKKYSKTTIQSLLSQANIDEADLIYFLLNTGFRDEEAAYAEWSDIDFQDRSINVYAKPRTASRPWEWKPKDDDSREESIPLSPEFVARMQARRERLASRNCALIFPAPKVCKPNENLLRIVRRLAQRAGIEQRMSLHLFRKTFGSTIARNYGIETARKCLGHSKIATTQGYISSDSDDAQNMRQSIASAFADYAPQGS